jgi:hypothetical protein
MAQNLISGFQVEEATVMKPGVMPAADKEKLDTIPSVETSTSGQVLTSQGDVLIWTDPSSGLTPRQIAKSTALRAF